MVCAKFFFHFANVKKKMTELTTLNFCKGHDHLYVQRAPKMVFISVHDDNTS